MIELALNDQEPHVSNDPPELTPQNLTHTTVACYDPPHVY